MFCHFFFFYLRAMASKPFQRYARKVFFSTAICNLRLLKATLVIIILVKKRWWLTVARTWYQNKKKKLHHSLKLISIFRQSSLFRDENMKCPLKPCIHFFLFCFVLPFLLFICFISETTSLGNLATIVNRRGKKTASLW